MRQTLSVVRRLAIMACAATLAAPAGVTAGSAAPQWRYFDDAPSPFLQFSTTAPGDPHRTTIACDGPPRTILIEQALTPREATAGADTFALQIGRLRLSPRHTTGADTREEGVGRVVTASFDVWSSEARSLEAAGRIALIVRGRAISRPSIPSGWLHRFLTLCRSGHQPEPTR